MVDETNIDGWKLLFKLSLVPCCLAQKGFYSTKLELKLRKNRINPDLYQTKFRLELNQN